MIIQYNPTFTLFENAKIHILVTFTTQLTFFLAISHHGYPNHRHQDLFQT